MKADRVSIMTDSPTRDRLTAFLAAERLKAIANPDRYPPWFQGGLVGLGDALRLLLWYHDQEASRKRSYPRRKPPVTVVDKRRQDGAAGLVAPGFTGSPAA